MRDPQRIEPILNTIREIWYSTPDSRFTQLIMNALKMNKDPYYVEDDILFKKLKEYKNMIENQN